ncbi:hypothetical protein [Micromonospora echinospora]|uniref:hypothetical protein n=1 Tax=Micromonospora echinospora TaxID=1877 RepID=UPI00366A59FE
MGLGKLSIAAALTLTVVFGPLVGPVRATDRAAVPAVPELGQESMPDRLGAPLWGTDSVRERPSGRASVIFTSELWWWGEANGAVAAVGATGDEYRVFWDDDLGRAGEQVLLSPDGSRVALTDQVIDLGDGQSRRLPRLPGVATTGPAAWSPQGDRLAVLGTTRANVVQPDGAEEYRVTRAVLGLVNLTSGSLSTIADVEPGSVVDGFTVAFAPDGRRLAYQSGSTIVVADGEGTEHSRFTVPAETRLAGKGAWTPDGRGLSLVTQRRCCADEAYPSRWRLHVVDPATGADLPAPAIPEQTSLTALRLMGWSPQGEAVVARYHPEPEEKVVGFEAGIDLTDPVRVSRVDVAALRPGAKPHVLIATPVDDVQALDVAGNLIASGTIRRGQPPTGLGPNTKVLTGVVALALLATTTLVVVVVGRSRRRPAPQGMKDRL